MSPSPLGDNGGGRRSALRWMRCAYPPYLLQGKRATYGEQIVSTLSRQLETEYGRGFSAKNLWYMLRFAEVFASPEIVSAARRQWCWTFAYYSGRNDPQLSKLVA